MIDALDPAASPGESDDAKRARVNANAHKMQAAGASPDEIEHYVRDVEGLKPVGAAPPDPRTTRHDGTPFVNAPADTSESGAEAARGRVQQALQGATFGFGDELTAGARAVLPEKLGGTKGFDYSGALADERQSLKQYQANHPVESKVLGIASSIPSVIATGGMGELASGAGVGAKVMSAAKLGALYGGVQGVGEGEGTGGRLLGGAVGAGLGGAMGAATVPAMGAIGGLGKALHVPQAASWLMGKAASGADMLPAPETANLLRQGANSVGPKGAAGGLLGERVGIDNAAGYTPPTRASGPGAVPYMPINDMGPATTSLAENIAQRRREGGGIIANAVQDRQAQMRPSVTSALEAGTGQSADDGMGGVQRMVSAQKAQSGTNYQAARDATADVDASSPTLDQVRATPSGKIAYGWAMAKQGNTGRLLPGPDVVPPAPPGVDPAKWAAAAKASGASEPGEPLPTPETLHLMKQRLAKMARLDATDEASGALATDAQSNLNLWGKIRNEMPDIWKDADAAHSAAMGVQEQNTAGRRIFNTPLNPNANARNAVAKSLPGVQQAAQAASPEGQQAFQQGAATAAHSLNAQMPLNATSPAPTFARNPLRVQQLASAFPSPADADQFQRVVGDWNDMGKQSTRLLGGSQTFERSAEEGARSQASVGAIGQLLRGNLGSAAQTAMQGVSKASQGAARDALDAEVARMLTSPNANTMTEAEATYRLRSAVAAALHGGTASVAGANHPSHNPLSYLDMLQ